LPIDDESLEIFQSTHKKIKNEESKILHAGKSGENLENKNRLIRLYQQIKRFLLYPEPQLIDLSLFITYVILE
jgi:hypothetical protein